MADDFFASVTSLAFVGVGWTVVDSFSRFSIEFLLDVALALELLLELTFESFFDAFSVELFSGVFSIESVFEEIAFDVTAVATVVDAAAVVVCLSP